MEPMTKRVGNEEQVEAWRAWALAARRKRVATVGIIWAVFLLSLLALVMALGLTGCSLLGSQASAPGKFEESLFNVTNVPMVTVHELQRVVWVTNRAEVTVTNLVPVAVFRTNEVNEVNVTYRTNESYETRYVTNRVSETNVLPAGSTVMVPQLTGLSGKGEALAAGASGVAGLFGYGGIAGILLSGLGHWWQNARNRALAAQATGAGAEALAANQTTGALAQNIETLLEVLGQTTQGQKLLPGIKNYLVAHQAEAGVFTTVARLVAEEVDNPAAKEAAGAILSAAGILGLPGQGTMPVGVTKA